MTKTSFESKDNSKCQGVNITICEVIINREFLNILLNLNGGSQLELVPHNFPLVVQNTKSILYLHLWCMLEGCA